VKTPKDLAARSTRKGSVRPPLSGPAGRRSRSRILGIRARSIVRMVFRRSSGRTVMICSSCELVGGPFGADEAALLLKVHEQLHHGDLSMHRAPLPPPI
jgi:hypothetical protein